MQKHQKQLIMKTLLLFIVVINVLFYVNGDNTEYYSRIVLCNNNLYGNECQYFNCTINADCNSGNCINNPKFINTNICSCYLGIKGNTCNNSNFWTGVAIFTGTIVMLCCAYCLFGTSACDKKINNKNENVV